MDFYSRNVWWLWPSFGKEWLLHHYYKYRTQPHHSEIQRQHVETVWMSHHMLYENNIWCVRQKHIFNVLTDCWLLMKRQMQAFHLMFFLESLFFAYIWTRKCPLIGMSDPTLRQRKISLSVHNRLATLWQRKPKWLEDKYPSSTAFMPIIPLDYKTAVYIKSSSFSCHFLGLTENIVKYRYIYKV